MHRRHLTYAATGVAVLALAGCAPQQFVTLDDLLSGQPYRGVTNPHEDTDAVCEGLDGCVEGWRSDGAEYARFSSVSAATTFAETLEDRGFQTNFLVIRCDDAVDATHRRLVEELFLGAHQSE